MYIVLLYSSQDILCTSPQDIYSTITRVLQYTLCVCVCVGACVGVLSYLYFSLPVVTTVVVELVVTLIDALLVPSYPDTPFPATTVMM